MVALRWTATLWAPRAGEADETEVQVDGGDGPRRASSAHMSAASSLGSERAQDQAAETHATAGTEEFERVRRALIASHSLDRQDIARAARAAALTPKRPPAPLSRALEPTAAEIDALIGALVGLGLIDAGAAADALAEASGAPRASADRANDGSTLAPDDAAALSALSPTALRDLRAAPVALGQDSATVLVANPFDPYPAMALGVALSRSIRISVATPAEIDAEIAALEARRRHPSAARSGASSHAQTDDLTHLRARAEAGPVVRFVADLIDRARIAGASDIHLEPVDDGVGLSARLRVDGVLRDAPPPPPELSAAIASRIKIMAGLDIAERRRPQDGRISLDAAPGGGAIDLRVATTPALGGEALTLRVLRRDAKTPSLADLGAAPASLAVIEKALDRAAGLSIVAGPTGAGKTTTLYAMLARLSGPGRKVVAIEDPIERRIAGVSQIQARSDLGVGFAETLRATLRHDPDVVMVGETRDAETASVATQAALTGHAVLTSLHTDDAAAAPARLAEMGVARYLIAATLKTVVAQRLLRRLCPDCRRAEAPSPSLAAAFALAEAADRRGAAPTVFRAGGCETCRGTGVSGRVGVFEAITVDATIAALIVEGAPVSAIRAAARAQGAASLRQAAVEKALDGVVSLEEAARVLGRTE